MDQLKDLEGETAQTRSPAALLWALLVLALGLPLSLADSEPADAHGGRSSTAVWVGSPVNGTWPNSNDCWRDNTYPSAWCSLPYAHHTYNYGDQWRGDWGIDIQSLRAGAGVFLYAAPKNTRYNSQITAHVKSVVPACGRRSGESRSQTLARGGYAVVIELRHSGSVIGTVKYVHVDPTAAIRNARSGQAINRWGTKIGTVGSYRSNGCWNGVHLHFEMTNQRHYSCYNRGWRPGQGMNRSNFVGFLGGHYASGPRQRCP